MSECSLDDVVDLEAGLAEITKASPDKAERNCRICHLGLDSAAAESGAGIVLGCSCKNDLSRAHKQCAETWFKIRGNKYMKKIFLVDNYSQNEVGKWKVMGKGTMLEMGT